MLKPNSLITNYKLLIIWLLICLTILTQSTPVNTHAQEAPSIIINEIAAFESTSHEWIEVHNPTDQPIDITDWKFVESYTDSKPNGINHSLITFQGDFLIEAGEYAIIAQNADNFIIDYLNLPDNLTIFDSSWSTLSESGEQISLKDSSGNTIEQFTYPACPEYSLERKNPCLIDYTDNNWQQSISGSTPGQPNSVKIEYYSMPTTNEQPSSPETSEPTTKTDNNSPVTNYQSLITINEIFPNPEGDDDAEFIELKNLYHQNIDLNGFIISDSSNKIFTITNSVIIAPNQFWVLPKLETKISLNNSDGDIVNLYQPDGLLIDSVYYSEDAENGWSYAKKDNNTWSWTTTPTKNQENIITFPVSPKPTDQHIEEPSQPTQLNLPTANYESPIIITEFLPNPSGPDQTGEWIELYNPNTRSVNLTNWKICDNSSHKYTINLDDFNTTIIEPGEYFLLPRTITNIALNNSGGDILKLYQPDDDLVDEIKYTNKIDENISYILINQEWSWTTTPTPGDDNILTQPNSPPIAFFEIDGSQTNTPITFDASESFDPENQPLIYLWQFDNTTTTPTTTPLITHIFTIPGLHEIILTVQDDQTLISTHQQSFNAQSPDSEFTDSQTNNYPLLITELFPNPQGTDENQEWIEIFNPSDQPINLIHCQLDDIANAGSHTFLIEQDLIIQPRQYLVFTRQQTKIALNNTYDSIRLIDPFDNLIHEINYDDVPENMTYALNSDKTWFWTSIPTPGQENQITQLAISLNSSTSRQYQPILTVDMDKIKQYDIGDQLKTSGVVSVEPGILGKNIFYIYSPELESGIQIYSYTKDFPDLHIGDTVEITGTLSQSMGEERLKISQADNIKTINTADPQMSISTLEPKKVNIEDLSDSSVGSLVSVSGQIVEIKGAYIYIDDGTEELKTYLKQTTQANAKDLNVGDQLSITGIFSQTSSGFRLLPRSPQDIQVQKILGENTSLQNPQTITLAQNSRNQTFIKYLLVTIIALLFILVGLFLKK